MPSKLTNLIQQIDNTKNKNWLNIKLNGHLKLCYIFCARSHKKNGLNIYFDVSSDKSYTIDKLLQSLYKHLPVSLYETSI